MKFESCSPKLKLANGKTHKRWKIKKGILKLFSPRLINKHLSLCKAENNMQEELELIEAVVNQAINRAENGIDYGLNQILSIPSNGFAFN